jgi:hypothetical protein
MATHYYVYLTREEWAEAWESGGPVPINPASSYLSDVREGTQTPDETLQRSSRGVPDWVIGGNGGTERGSPIQLGPNTSLSIIDCVFEGFGHPTAHVAEAVAHCHFEDGLILSLSTRLDGGLASRLGKAACVRINSMPRLISELNRQIGTDAKSGPIQYRDGYARNHFLKATADQWQQEYRLLWVTEDVSPRMVQLPAGIASRAYWP